MNTKSKKFYSGYAVYSTIPHMLCMTTYDHFASYGAAIYGLLHQTVEEETTCLGCTPIESKREFIEIVIKM